MVGIEKKTFLSSKFIYHDKWLENIFKKNCYIIKNFKIFKLLKTVKNSFILLKTKKKIAKENSVRNLKFIDINKTYLKNIKKTDEYIKKEKISYRTKLKTSEKKIIIELAYKNFKLSRFHLDKRLSNLKANLIKKKTLQNFFSGGRGNIIFVQFYEGKISGFCLLIYEKIYLARIDLICIDKKFSSKGLAKDLINYCFYSLKKINIKKVIVSTNGKNLAANKLYRSLKFVPKSKLFMYHYIS